MRRKPKRTWQLVILLALALAVPGIAHADPLDQWTSVNPPLEELGGLWDITHGNGIFMGVFYDFIATSPDGITWISRQVSTESSFGLHLNGVTYGNGLFVATGLFGAILTSPDGVVWTQTLQITYGLSDVAYGNGVYVAVGGLGAIFTSPDGITWTQRATPDGITWSGPGVGNRWLRGVTYGSGSFVAVGDFGILLTSPDGATWNQRASGITNRLIGVTYGNGTFVAVGYGSVLTSLDGVTWTQRTSGTDDWFYGITYGNGTFVAIRYDGTVATSPDGATWTQRTTATTEPLNAIAYGNGFFVATAHHIIVSAPASGINLSPGWNFVSLPKQPSNTVIDAVLADVSSTAVIVWGYDNQDKTWKKWKPQGSANTLTAMESGKGYWIYMNAAGAIDMVGWTPPVANVPLYKGWNLVGYSGTDNRTVPLALSVLAGNWSLVWNWGYPQWQAKHRTITALPGFDALDTFRQTKAYWIKVDGQDTNWSQ
jgi:hypothetical protein